MSASTRPRESRIRRRHSERGAVLILVSLSLTVLLVIVALVVDMGFVRQNRQADKSATDFAAAAGIRGLDDGSGYVKTWKGICAARDFLVANNAELTALVHIDATGNPIADPCANPPNTSCGTPATWGTYRGLADGGRLRVTIQNGYDLAASGFSEDADAYAGVDQGDGPCDNLAVIIEEREGAYFGGVAGAASYNTRIRTVARLSQGAEGDAVAALVLLERKDCRALNVGGTDDTIVQVEGNGTTPGVIHSDSTGTGAGCSSEPVYDIDGNTPKPRIVTTRATVADPDTGLFATGLISAVSLTVANADPAGTSAGIHAVCAQIETGDCLGSGGGSGPTARGVVGRTRVDLRYRKPVLNLRDDAATRFAWDAATAELAGFEAVPCDDPRTDFTAAKVFIHGCGATGFDATGKTFSADVKEVVIRGKIKLSGVVQFKAPARVYIEGIAGDTISLGNGNEFRVNDGDSADCDARKSVAPTARSVLVIGNGRVKSTGGSVFRLCQTTMVMLDGSDPSTGPCKIPTVDGSEPSDNACNGNVGVSGGVIDWTAPNVKDDPDDPPLGPDFEHFEDLALWSETSGAGGSAWDVLGSGGLTLAGVFFTPNANPFKIGGGGSIDVEDAQFITRKLSVTGGGLLTMRPEAHNSVLIPVLGGFTLVR